MKQMHFSFLVVLLAACGGGTSADSNGEPDAGAEIGSGSAVGSDGAALTCKDFAYCSTYSVNQYIGDVDSPAGGRIGDGEYRLAYIQQPASSNASNDTVGDTARAFRFQNGTYVSSSVEGRGTFSTNGTTLTLNATNNCNLGSEGDVFDSVDTEVYTATDDRLVLFDQYSDGNNHWTVMQVFLKVSDVCQTVDAPPSTPGDSYRCNNTNCVCATSTHGTIQACD